MLATEENHYCDFRPTPDRFSQIIDMDVKDYDQNYERDASNLLSKLDLDHPERIVVEDKSIHQLMRQYMSAQSDTSARLIGFIGKICAFLILLLFHHPQNKTK